MASISASHDAEAGGRGQIVARGDDAAPAHHHRARGMRPALPGVVVSEEGRDRHGLPHHRAARGPPWRPASSTSIGLARRDGPVDRRPSAQLVRGLVGALADHVAAGVLPRHVQHGRATAPPSRTVAISEMGGLELAAGMPQAQRVRDVAAVHGGPPPRSAQAAGAKRQVVEVGRDLEPPPALVHALRRMGRDWRSMPWQGAGHLGLLGSVQ